MSGGRWVWVVAPPADLAPGRVDTRCCHPSTAHGDLGVVYRSQRGKDVAYLVRVCSDAVIGEDGPRCDVEVLERLPHPVPIAELRADPVTSTWPALRASFVRRVMPVPDDVWRRLLEMSGSGADDGAWSGTRAGIP